MLIYTIIIVISETQPIGIFYNGENYFLFDNNLEVIDLLNPGAKKDFVQYNKKKLH